MGQQPLNSVIHRKAQVGRDDFDARAMSPSKALRLSLAKAADALLDLAVTVTTVEQRTLPVADLRKELGDEGLIVLLDGYNGARGAMILDVQLLSALIEVQTMGQIRRGPAEPRPVTRTDAAIAAPLVDALLEGFDAEMVSGLPEHEPAGYRFGDRMEDARSLLLALAKPEYDMFRISVDIADGAKAGVLTTLMPVTKRPSAATGSVAPTQSTGRLEQCAMTAPAVLDAVVARLMLPLNELFDLKPGKLLPVGRDSIEKTQLLGAKGHVVAHVKLGQLNGWRAVRLIPETAGDGSAKKTSEMPAPPQSPKVEPPDSGVPAEPEKPAMPGSNPDPGIDESDFAETGPLLAVSDQQPATPGDPFTTQDEFLTETDMLSEPG